MVRVGWGYHHTAHRMICVNQCVYNSDNFATSVALAEACALLSVVLVLLLLQALVM